MKYKYTSKENFEDLSSGRVLYSLPGASAFPIRLMSEIFQICQSLLPNKEKLSIYDPCCGSAYHLTSLAFLHPDIISKIICSDINPDILKFAKQNLSLLNVKGLQIRIDEINDLINKYNKLSHKEALESAFRLQSKIENSDIKTEYFIMNLLLEQAPNLKSIDIVFADIPYDNLEKWKGNPTSENEVKVMLSNLFIDLNPNSIIVIASAKKQVIEHANFIRIKKLTIGKRKITFLKPTSN
jgi:16S rRNA G966 N2-methylase RsmD